MNPGSRLREERERLGFSQTAFAELVGASKHAQINWEKGTTYPNAGDLQKWAAIGLDVLFVVTGQRGQAVPPSQALPREETEWLDLYRGSTPEMRAALRAAGDAYTKAAKRRDKAA
ncbi:helix-turn-helix domain-containing protein [Variovorax sp.]|uniref:helix-turn-helix domain-containing protein n=1 Tax=Variovorax sp. TaxID=1871043 RepID=UPI003BAA6100